MIFFKTSIQVICFTIIFPLFIISNSHASLKTEPITCEEVGQLMNELLETHVIADQLPQTEVSNRFYDNYVKALASKKSSSGSDPLANKTDEQIKSQLLDNVIEGDCSDLKNLSQSLSDKEQDTAHETYLETAIDAFAKSMDPHSGFLSSQYTNNYLNSFSTGYSGIGVEIIKSDSDSKVQITKIYRGGAAFNEKSLKAGDFIESVDGVNTEGCDTHCMVDFLLGPPGTKVKVTVSRNNKLIQAELTRKKILPRDTSLYSEVVVTNEQKFGYIRLDQFYIGSGEHIGEELEKINKNTDGGKTGVDSLIFDVRSNSGGSMVDMAKAAGYFVGNKVVAKGIGRQSQIDYLDPEARIIFHKPVIILVDQLTKSAAETFAGSLKALSRAVVVGTNGTEKTYGKGSIYTWRTLVRNDKTNYGIIRISTHLTYLPSGQATQLQGITPHISLPSFSQSVQDSEPGGVTLSDTLPTYLDSQQLSLSEDGQSENENENTSLPATSGQSGALITEEDSDYPIAQPVQEKTFLAVDEHRKATFKKKIDELMRFTNDNIKGSSPDIDLQSEIFTKIIFEVSNSFAMLSPYS